LKLNRRTILSIIAIAVVVFSVSLWPGFKPEHIWDGSYSRQIDFLCHSCFYLSVTLFLLYCFPNHRWQIPTAVLVVSVCMEFLQALIPGRTASIFDALSNTAGIFLAILITTIVFSSGFCSKERDGE
jgi:VanZ family protein